MLRLDPVFRCPGGARDRRETAMGNASSDRSRMRHDLRELAKLAGPTDSSATPHGFETADSSGYVDLSAFSATDESWIEKELARASGRAQGGAVLTPGSMAPVAMTALLDAEPEAPASTRKRGRVYAALFVSGVAAVTALAVVLARHRPPAATASQAETAPAAAAAAPPIATPTASSPAPEPQAAARASAAPPPVAVSTPDPSPGLKKHGASHAHPAHPAPAAHAATGAAPARPVSIPPAKGGGNDSLMELMRASINGSKK